MSPWVRAVSQSVETLVMMRLHVSANIHALFLASCYLVIWILYRRTSTRPSYLVGMVGKWEDPCATSEVICVFSQGETEEAPQDNVLI